MGAGRPGSAGAGGAAALSDEGLWAAVLVTRDRAAFTELCRRHRHHVHALAWRLTGDEESARDVVQDVFLRLWEAPQRYRPERGELRRYLLRDCHGRAVDSVRAEVRTRLRGTSWAGRQPSESASAEDVALDAVRDSRLRELLAALPVRQRQALLLAFVHELPYRTVAAALDLPEGTVKSRIRAGLRALQESLAAGTVDATAR